MYNYALNEEQKEAAYKFIEAIEELEKSGVAVVDEQESGTLCFINGNGVEFDRTGKRCPVIGQISTMEIESEKIVCIENPIVTMEVDEVIDVVPAMHIVSKDNLEDE